MMKKGTKHTKETKEKMRESHLGKKFSEEHKRNLSLNHKGMFGKCHSFKTKEKISFKNNGEKHGRYKNNPTKNVIHRFVEKRKMKPKNCENCNERKKVTLANMRNHNYTRNPADYKWLCYSCHRDFDLRGSLK